MHLGFQRRVERWYTPRSDSPTAISFDKDAFKPNKPIGCVIPIIENVVATVSVGTRLDLDEIARKARNVEYNPKRFAALIMRRREPKCTALVFGSGKLVVVGPKTEDASRLAARKCARVLGRIIPDVRFEKYRIQNIVARAVLPFKVNLNTLSDECAASFEPEIFPGMVWRIKEPKCTVLVFFVGKLVITGLKSANQVAEVFTYIYPILEAHGCKIK